MKFIVKFLIFFIVSFSLNCIEVPPLQGRVNDYAGILSQAEINNITLKLAELEESSSAQVVSFNS